MNIEEVEVLSLQESVTMFVQDYSRQGEAGVPRQRGVSQLGRMRRKGQWHRFLKRLAGQATRLQDLASDLQHMEVKGRYATGMRSVPIDRIRGSEGRSQDFDSDFYPLTSQTDERWISVAAAAQAGVSLPPVDLIQVGDIYYVRDGHHRVSVARALGQEAIEAEVTVWETGE